MAYLIQKNTDDSFAQQWEVGGAPLRVGRGDEVDAKINDQKMSRVHFVIEERSGVHYIVDQKSTNGTWVNDRKIVESELKPDDRILAGHTGFVFQSGFGSMIQRISEEPRSYSTRMRKISPDLKP